MVPCKQLFKNLTRQNVIFLVNSAIFLIFSKLNYINEGFFPDSGILLLCGDKGKALQYLCDVRSLDFCPYIRHQN
jgi:hypothetical protein